MCRAGYADFTGHAWSGAGVYLPAGVGAGSVRMAANASVT